MDKDFFYDFIAGWIGGCAGLVAGHPMDTIKVRQQIMGRMTVFKCLVNTFKYEGVRGFYKGIGFPLLTTGTLNSLFFGVYGNTIRYMNSENGGKMSYLNVFLAGCAGGVIQLSVACPVDLVKIKMQMQTGNGSNSWAQDAKPRYKGPAQCLLDLYKKGGVPGCYKGLVSMGLRDVPSFGIYMVIYEALIRSISGTEDLASPTSTVFCGGMAGALSWISIVPLDVVKSRLQADDITNPKYKGMWDCASKSYKSEGLSVFFRGFFMVTIRAFPTNGAIFLGYVTSLNLLRGHYDNSENVL